MSNGQKQPCPPSCPGCRRRRLVRLTQTLIRIASYYPGPGEQPVVDFLEPYLRKRGFKTTVQAVVPGRPNLIADLGQGEGGLILEGHTDVVTHGSLDQWTVPPYEARIADGKIYGRGACDMKGGLAAAICAAVAVQKVLGPPQKTLRLCIPCDEEGLMIGIKAFIRAGYAEALPGLSSASPRKTRSACGKRGPCGSGCTFRGRWPTGPCPMPGPTPFRRPADS